MKIIILGSSGSGKTTFAKKLQKKTGLPLFHLDAIWWKADRTHISREEFDQKLASILAGEEWIIDGDYSRTYEVRFAAADTVIFFDLPEEECLSGIRARVGRERGDMPWIDETLDPALVEQVRRYRTEKRPEVYRLIEKYTGKKICIFRSRKDADAFLADRRNDEKAL